MEVVKRKAESGRIWKNYGETRENEGNQTQENDQGKSQAVDFSTGFAIIITMNDAICDIPIQLICRIGDHGMIIAL